ncbi:hypothetical protein [Maricaulis sp.]|uniref:hypothetical protein n=1 Tax=Maricaulis sp. TaxID=1486257 RepID=UPI003A947DE1
MSMRHTIEFDYENRWAVTAFHGPVSIPEAAALLRQAVSLPEWTPDWDRIIDYSDGMLGDLDVEAIKAGKAVLGQILHEAYGDKPTLSAQVCADPMKLPLVEYWIGLGEADYPASLQLFDTLAAAKAWLIATRKAQGRGGDQAQPV